MSSFLIVLPARANPLEPAHQADRDNRLHVAEPQRVRAGGAWMRKLFRVGRSLPLLLLAFAARAEDTRLLRFPDVCGDRVAFVQAGDLHVVSVGGGLAKRLTSHMGQELYPKFSPDCGRIAFSAEYDGTRQVYVVGADGGQPRQLTWYNDAGLLPLRSGSDYRVLDWTPDAKHVLVLANRTAHSNRNGRPYLVPVDGGMERPLPMPESGGGSLAPDGRQYVYTPLDNDFRSWKQYRGGRAPDVWAYDLANNSARRLTHHRASDAHPMWLGDTVYFASDRDGTVNLYALAAGQSKPKRVTDFKTLDVMWPSAGVGAIVFERDGWLWRFVPSTRQVERIHIEVPEPFRYAGARSKPVAKNVESFAATDGGESVVFGARGEVLSLQRKSGSVTNLTATPTARERGVTLSPDGTQIAYLSDATGEYELYVRSLSQGAARQITRNGSIWRFAPTWSPDGNRIAFADHARRLWVVEVTTGRIQEVDRDEFGDLTDHAWSPDGRWLAYTRRNSARLDQVWLYSVDDGSRHVATEEVSGAFSPSFDPAGRWLYVLSKRDFGLTMSAYEENFVPAAATRLYAIGLTTLAPAWDKAKSQTASIGLPKEGFSLDQAGLVSRVQALPVAPGDYRVLRATAAAVFFLSGSEDDADADALVLKTIEVGGERDKSVVEQLRGYSLAGDGHSAVVQRGEEFSLIAARPNQDFASGKIDVSGLAIELEPRNEWKQSFNDAWRILRDWFYDPQMHGGLARWTRLRTKYASWVDHAAQRSDLDYVLSELVGELNASHLYVDYGDQPKVPRRSGGLLGAEIDADPSGYFRIARILPGESWHKNARSPLEGLAHDGDYILAVDDVDARGSENLYQLLQGKGDKQVSLLVNKQPTLDGARRIQVQTITAEHGLRKLAWVRERREMVDRLSKGSIGYIHVPNTSESGYGALLQGILAYRDKEALIIDDRYNSGGLVPDRFIELLARQPLKQWRRRDQPLQSTPQLSHDGPKAMLINGFSASGGDTFAHYFRQVGLGPLVGTRTWGGTIAIDGNPKLADGGQVQVASARSLGLDGRWVIENEGVVPDLEVVDSPDMQAAGRDPSLEAAVSLLLEKLARENRSDTAQSEKAAGPISGETKKEGKAQ